MNFAVHGKATASGIGSMNYDLVRLSESCRAWFVPDNTPIHEPYRQGLPRVECLPDIQVNPAAWTAALQGCDFLVFVERPAVRKPEYLFAHLQRIGVRTVCIPNWEGLPTTGWARSPDVMWATSQFTHNLLKQMVRKDPNYRWANQIYGARWGVDPSVFPFRQRTRCERFLFVNGHGGQHQRKGLDTLDELLYLDPSLPFLVVGTTPFSLRYGRNVTCLQVTTAERAELYQEGDVYVSLSHWEGLGLQIMEAQACGLPTLVPGYAPVTEYPHLKALSGKITGTQRLRARTVERWTANVSELARELHRLLGTDISQASLMASASVGKYHADVRTVVRAFEAMLQGVHNAENSSGAATTDAPVPGVL